MIPSPFPALAAARLRHQVRSALKHLSVASPRAAAPGDVPGFETVGPRLWVSSLAGEALWLGSYQRTYDLSDAQWSDIATHLSGYGNLPLVRPLNVIPAHRTNAERLRDERPIVDAVLQLSQHGPLESITFADVAALSGHSSTALQASFGDIDQLMIDVVRQVHDGGFDEVSPLRLHLDRHALSLSLQGLEDERKITAVHRLYALAGVPPAAHKDVRARARTLARTSTRYFDHLDLITAALAIDGWQGAHDHIPAFFPRALPHVVALEIARLADPSVP